jgi:hypothetical protein
METDDPCGEQSRTRGRKLRRDALHRTDEAATAELKVDDQSGHRKHHACDHRESAGHEDVERDPAEGARDHAVDDGDHARDAEERPKEAAQVDRRSTQALGDRSGTGALKREVFRRECGQESALITKGPAPSNREDECRVGCPALRGRLVEEPTTKNVAKCANSVTARLDRSIFVA